MLFCIICGHSLSGAPAGQAAPSVTISKPEDLPEVSGQRPAASLVLVCTICKKNDPLNGQFCVYCGGRTAAGPAPIPAFTSASALPATHLPATETGHISQEVVRPLAAKAPKGAGSTKPALFAALLAGTVIALSCTYQFRQEIEKLALKSCWPTAGVLVFSSSANTDFSVQDAKRQSLILGRTSPDGSSYIPTVSPGSYTLTLSESNGKNLSKDFTVRANETNVIGYPNRLELK